MSKFRINLVTQSDIIEFVNIANSTDKNVWLEDVNELRVNGKSILGVMYGTSDFETLYCVTDDDTLQTKLLKFLI